MDKDHDNLRSTNLGVLPTRKSKFGVGARKLSKRKKQKASLTGSEEKGKNGIFARFGGRVDKMDTFILLLFWSVVIVFFEVGKWVAAFHLAKYLPFVQKFMGH